MKQASRVLVAALLLGTPVLAQAQTASSPPPPVASTPPDYPRGKISGYIFGDYYYNVTGDPTHTYNASGQDLGKANIDGTPNITKDLNGFQIRRVYFQHDADISAKFSTRFRLEADSKSLTSDGKIGVAVKAAYGQVKNALPQASFFFGMIPTPAFENSEEYWGYRAIEKTMLDFRGIRPSADVGAELKGALDPDKKINYVAMIGNGPGQKPEDNRYKAYYLALPLRPIEELRIEPYVDYQPVAGKKDQATYKLFAGYDLKHGAVGTEIMSRVNHNAIAGPRPNQEPFGISVFGRYTHSDQIAAFARYDRWQPDTHLAKRLDSDLYIAGVDWQPYKDIHFMPNIEATQYRPRGGYVAHVHPDLQARVTMYWKFSKP